MSAAPLSGRLLICAARIVATAALVAIAIRWLLDCPAGTYASR